MSSPIDTSLEIIASLEFHTADLHAIMAEHEPNEHRAISECSCKPARAYRAASQWRRAMAKGKRYLMDTTTVNQLSALERMTERLRWEALIEVDDRGLGAQAAEQYYLIALGHLEVAQRHFALARLGLKA